MSIFNFNEASRPKTITLDDQRSVLRGSRNSVTGQAVLMPETDAESHRKFIAEFVATPKSTPPWSRRSLSATTRSSSPTSLRQPVLAKEKVMTAAAA